MHVLSERQFPALFRAAFWKQSVLGQVIFIFAKKVGERESRI